MGVKYSNEFWPWFSHFLVACYRTVCPFLPLWWKQRKKEISIRLVGLLLEKYLLKTIDTRFLKVDSLAILIADYP